MSSHFLTRMLQALRGGGDSIAFQHYGRATTYRESDLLLRTLCAGLGRAGIGTGDVLAVIGGNRPETVLVQLAAQLRGARVLQVAQSASLPDRAAAIAESGARAVVVDPRREPATVPELLRALEPLPVLTLGPDTEGGATPDVLAAEPRRSLGELPGSVYTIFPSGGTTGPAKLIGHRGIYEGMAHIFHPEPSGPGRVLLVAPMSHLTGNTTVLGALLCGDTVVLHDGFDAAAVLRSISEDRITSLSLTPPRLAQLLDHPALHETDLTSLRILSLGAGPLSAHRLRQALAVFGPIVRQGYGLTEAPMIAGIKSDEYPADPRRYESVGRIVPGMQACVVEQRAEQDEVRAGSEAGDLGEHREAGDLDKVGEVCVRGLALMEGYYGQPHLTAQAMGDGWLRTGDIGYFDVDGYLFLLDRADDVIITGEHASKVYSTVVENALVAHPLVRHAAVHGRWPAEADGEAVHAVVVPTEAGVLGTVDVQAHVRRLLGQEHVVPATVEFTTELPLTPVGKVDKKALRARTL